MSVLVLPLDHGDAAADARFVPLLLDGEWTVWDVERERHIEHAAVWDAAAARDVAASLAEYPTYISIWNWVAR